MVACKRDGDSLVGGLHVLPQIKEQCCAFSALVERVAAHVEVVGDDWFEFAAVAMGVGEPPDAAPVLQRAEAARQDAADAAVTAWTGIVVFRDGERPVEQPCERAARAADAALLDDAFVGAAGRQPPRLIQEVRMVDVEMVVHIVVIRADVRRPGSGGTEVHVCQKRLATKVFTQETLHFREHVRHQFFA